MQAHMLTLTVLTALLMLPACFQAEIVVSDCAHTYIRHSLKKSISCIVPGCAYGTNDCIVVLRSCWCDHAGAIMIASPGMAAYGCHCAVLCLPGSQTQQVTRVQCQAGTPNANQSPNSHVSATCHAMKGKITEFSPGS